MANDVFNLTGKDEALRKLLVTFVDVSEDGSTPVWEAQGYKTEDSALELNPDIKTITDVLGETYTDVNKLEQEQSFEPNTLRAGSKLNPLLHTWWRRGQLEKFAGRKVMVGHGYIGTDGSFAATLWDSCTLVPQSIGGDSRVNFPFNINFGGKQITGKIDKLQDGCTFTPDAVVTSLDGEE